MNKLPENFELDKYGLHVRLVREEDAEFIVKLRNDPKKARYISVTSNCVDDQIRWIKSYKEREKEGKDYYFIYSYQGQLAGVNRIYEIENNHFIHGSWVFVDDIPPYCALAAGIIARELAFETLGLEEEIDTAGVHRDNTSVLQYIRLLGAEFTGTKVYSMGEYLTSKLTKEKYNQNKLKITRLFPKKVL
jgi:RimJ/RimL family protein N-acetyltransferase